MAHFSSQYDYDTPDKRIEGTDVVYGLRRPVAIATPGGVWVRDGCVASNHWTHAYLRHEVLRLSYGVSTPEYPTLATVRQGDGTLSHYRMKPLRSALLDVTPVGRGQETVVQCVDNGQWTTGRGCTGAIRWGDRPLLLCGTASLHVEEPKGQAPETTSYRVRSHATFPRSRSMRSARLQYVAVPCLNLQTTSPTERNGDMAEYRVNGSPWRFSLNAGWHGDRRRSPSQGKLKALDVMYMAGVRVEVMNESYI
jgi:hypothetical protein